MSFEKLQWMFPIAVALHNTEEAIEFSRWPGRTVYYPAVGSGAIWFGGAVVAAAAFLVTYFSFRQGKQSVAAYLVFGGVITMMANAIAPHLGALLWLRAYNPGLVTAVLINLPVMFILLRMALREGYVSGGRALAYGVTIPVLLFLSIRPLFWMGRELGF